MKNNPEREKTLHTIYTFLESLPIPIVLCKINTETFLPGIKIRDGNLLIDTNKLMYPGDILHEAGHIAVSLPEERTSLNDNVIEHNKSKEGEEFAVMLWSYAAAIHLEIQPEVVFHREGYKGESEWILKEYNNQNFIGLPLLQWMGLTYTDSEELHFPKMKKWLRE